MGKKIGIPRGLFYYRYFPLWKTFLEELGAEITVSDTTNKRILDDGVKACVDEACLPVKLFHGHVINLADRVDYIFIPRFTSISKNEYICPEFGGLPDMVRHTLKHLPHLIDTEVNLRKSARNSWSAALETGSYFTRDKALVKRAYTKALWDYRAFRDRARSGELPFSGGDANNRGVVFNADKTGRGCASCSPAGCKTTGCSTANYSTGSCGSGSVQGRSLKIAVIGHVYNIYDRYINMDMLDKLKKNGVQTITVEMIDEGEINRNAALLNKPMFWNFGRKAVGSAFHLIGGKELDGIIYVMSFGCGIDSFVCDLIERKVRRESAIPFIVLTLDEHSGEAGMNTRLEAFIDMIRINAN